MRWCPDGDFWRLFCELYFQQAACSTFQTCILNSHYGHTTCASMADIHSATAEIRGGKKERRRINDRMKIYMVWPITQGDHKIWDHTLLQYKSQQTSDIHLYATPIIIWHVHSHQVSEQVISYWHISTLTPFNVMKCWMTIKSGNI